MEIRVTLPELRCGLCHYQLKWKQQESNQIILVELCMDCLEAEYPSPAKGRLNKILREQGSI